MSLRPVSLVAGVAAAALAGCGGGGGNSTSTPAPSSDNPTSAKQEDFPKGSGLTFQDVQAKYPAQLSLGIGASVMRQGPNRVPFVVLDKGARPVLNAAVALYTVHQDGTDVRGPFVAKETKFDVKPAFLAKTSASDSSTAKVFYAAEVPFKGKPPQGVFALVRMDGRLVAASPSPLGVKSAQGSPPDVGDRAVSIHTETVKDGKKLSYLTTRVPPDANMVNEDFADVLGKKPVVLIFATPALCQSRVCGPVVDVAEQVRSEIGAKAAFIHQEIYKDNQPNKGLRPQLASWRLESEPWTFVIDRAGRISSRFEGAVSVPELRAAVQKVL
ncbi:MAG: hypothetical protein QOJ29_3559 [Thermoleophilaceae bacterium]|jgi:hypothetical protein|nr:hypothetical protein [Thermoleophilaceae bacterium]